MCETERALKVCVNYKRISPSSQSVFFVLVPPPPLQEISSFEDFEVLFCKSEGGGGIPFDYGKMRKSRSLRAKVNTMRFKTP